MASYHFTVGIGVALILPQIGPDYSEITRLKSVSVLTYVAVLTSLSKPFFFAFSDIPSPSSMDVTEVQDNAITVRWSPAKGPITGYRVTGAPKDGDGPTFSEVVGPGKCNSFIGSSF